MPLQPSLFLETIIQFLLPYFIPGHVDADAARAEILEILASYGTRTRAELLNAAQIVAFGMSTLDALAEAKTTDMSTALRIRFRGCANGLNRSCKANEKSLGNRLSCDPPAPTPFPQLVNDKSDAQAQQILLQAQTEITEARPTIPAPISAGPTLTERNKQAWGAAMLNALQEMGMRPADTGNASRSSAPPPN